MSKMAASSAILFKTGYSFISTPVTLSSDEGKAGSVEEARVGPLPSFAVHGTVALQPSDDSEPRWVYDVELGQSKASWDVNTPYIVYVK